VLGIVCHPINKSTGRKPDFVRMNVTPWLGGGDSKSVFIEENGGAIHTQEKC